MTPESAGSRMIVLEFRWEQDGGSRGEMFGPWAVTEDEAHLELITGFIRDWNRLSGHKATSVVMTLVTDPAGWVRTAEERAEAGQAYIARGVVPASEVRQGSGGGDKVAG
jgi:hypothetical protein